MKFGRWCTLALFVSFAIPSRTLRRRAFDRKAGKEEPQRSPRKAERNRKLHYYLKFRFLAGITSEVYTRGGGLLIFPAKPREGRDGAQFHSPIFACPACRNAASRQGHRGAGADTSAVGDWAAMGPGGFPWTYY